MGETRGKVGRIWNYVGVDLFLVYVKKSRIPSRKLIPSCVVRRQVTCFACVQVVICLNVLAHDVLGLHDVGGCFVSVCACFSIHNSGESVEMCSTAPLLAAMHDAKRSSQSHSSRSISYQERTTA